MNTLIEYVKTRLLRDHVTSHEISDTEININWANGSRPFNGGLLADLHALELLRFQVIYSRHKTVAKILDPRSSIRVLDASTAFDYNKPVFVPVDYNKAFGPCKDCKDTRIYQPLIGPPEPCQACKN